MARSLVVPLLLLSAGCVPVGRPEAMPDMRGVAFAHAGVVDVEGGRILPDHTVLIAGGRIRAIAPSAGLRVPSGVQVVDASGKYLIPGLIDTHVHLAWDLDSLMAPDNTRRQLSLQVPNGITTIREASTRGLERRTLAVGAAPDSFFGTPVPRIYVSGRVDARNVQRYGATDVRDLTRRLIALGVNGLKIRDGLSLADVRAAVEEARGAGLPVYGHTFESRRNYTREAVLAGVAGVMHVDGLAFLRPTGRADPPPSDSTDWQAMWLYRMMDWLHADPAASDSLIALMVENGVWLEPTLVTQAWIADPERWRERPGSRYRVGSYEQAREGWLTPRGAALGHARAAYGHMEDFLRRFHQAGGLVVAGTDGVPLPGFGLHDELELLVEAGLPSPAALQAATINAARALQWDDRIGTVEEGKLADIVLLDGNPLEEITNTRKISAVVVNGRYLDRQMLDALLMETEPGAEAPVNGAAQSQPKGSGRSGVDRRYSERREAQGHRHRRGR
jgi:imidazolonepropionase-like amidohydrolase